MKVLVPIVKMLVTRERYLCHQMKVLVCELRELIVGDRRTYVR